MRAANTHTVARSFLDEHAPSLAARAAARIAEVDAGQARSLRGGAAGALAGELASTLVDVAACSALLAGRLALEARVAEQLGHSQTVSLERSTALLAAIVGLAVDADRLLEHLRMPGDGAAARCAA